jgi:hypothetical protein
MARNLAKRPVTLAPNEAEGPAPSAASGSAAQETFDVSSQPAGSRLREETTAEGLVPLSPSVPLEAVRASLPRHQEQIASGITGSGSMPGLPASIVDGPSASVWRIGRGVAQLQASKPRSGEAAHGAVPSPQAPAWGTLRVFLGGTKNRRYCGGPAPSGASGRHSRGNENKPLTAISNRNSNDSRKRATLSESITSKFLIATKMHLSEEKAKRE